jgi:protein-S-isoprenylcysteine O-methyltransferase Ste14
MWSYIVISYWVWGLWLASWLIAAFWSDRAARKAAVGAELLYRVVTFVGAFLLLTPAHGLGLYRLAAPVAYALIAAQIAGFAFCWWARLHLGRLWSGTVGRKADHHVVDTGPYGLVRHPIYTGLETASIAFAILTARPICMLGAALVILGCWIKARLEERFLREELGAEAYDAYAARVPMLVPFWPKSR